MKKRLTVVLCIFTCLVLLAGLLTACVTEDSPQKYTISFYSGETLVGTVATAGNEKIVLPAAPAKAGYTFGGWYTDKDVWKDRLTEDSFAGRALTENLDVYARYIRNEEPSAAEYTISFYIDGALADTVRTSGNETLDLPAAPGKDGYTFAGWFFDNGTWRNELTADTYSEKPLTGDVSVYAFYEKTEEPVLPQEYTVFFDVDNGTPVAAVTTSRIEKQPQTTREGYTFEGWYADKNFTEKVTFPYEVTRAQTLYAKWEKNTYTVHFETDGGTAVGDMIVSVIERAPSTEKKGYTFDGWYTDKNFTEKVAFPYEVTRAQTLYAKWKKNTYTVHFETDGGTAVGDMIVSVIERAPSTEKKGYTFDGWYTDKNFTEKVAFPYEVTMAQTLYAKWTQNIPAGITFTVDADGVLTGAEGLTESDMTVEIPSVVNGITVREIGQDVFKDNKNIAVLIIPDTVERLGYRVCSGCTALREVRLSPSLRVISDEAFDGCSSLQKVNFPATLKEIRSDAFSGTALTEFTAPDSLTDIWGYAFKDCTALKSVELNNVRNLGSGAFTNCTALESVSLSDNMEKLNDHIFDGCASLARIDMPDKPIAVSFTVLGGTAYYNNPSNWEKGVLYADGYLIAVNAEFAALTEYAVKEGTKVIADNAFSGAGYSGKVKKITLPDGLYRIGQGAFAKFGALTKVNVPESVRSIGYGAFAATGYDVAANYTDGGLYVGNWLVAVENAVRTSFTVKDGTVGVADGKDTSLFPSRAQKATQLSLPSSLKYIGTRSFARLRITELQLPAGLQTLGEGAFASCSWLKTVNLGDCAELESIGAQAFTNAAITEITIPAGVVSVGELVFNQNTVDLTIRCEAPEKPEGWDENWSYSYRQGVTIAVEWNKA